MASWQDTFHEWTRAWAALHDLESHSDGPVVTFGNQRVMMWSGDGIGADAAHMEVGAELVLVTEDPAGATHFAQSQGLRATSLKVLLCAETESLDLEPHLPPDAYLAEAPMEHYDLVEVALFDRPVASGRLSLGEELAVVADLAVDEGHEELVPVFEQAMVAELGEDAFTHGADTLYLIASTEQADRFAAGEQWRKVAEILSFIK